MGEVVAVGTQHPVAAVGVAEGQRDGPGDAGIGGELLVALPADVVGGIADAEHRVEQQIDRTGAGAHHQVGTGDGAGEAGLGLGAQPFDAQQQGHRDGDGEDGEEGGGATIAQAGPGQWQEAAS